MPFSSVGSLFILMSKYVRKVRSATTHGTILGSSRPFRSLALVSLDLTAICKQHSLQNQLAQIPPIFQKRGKLAQSMLRERQPVSSTVRERCITALDTGLHYLGSSFTNTTDTVLTMQGLMMSMPMTISEILEHACHIFGTKQIVSRLPDRSLHTMTYRELYARVQKLANALEALGVQTGDRVATLGWNHHQHVEAYFGIPETGAIIHTLNLRLSRAQLSYIINHAQDKVVLLDESQVPLLESISHQIPCVKHVVVWSGQQELSRQLPGEVHHYEDLLAAVDADHECPVQDEQTAMGLCYTSGTTGHPKGVLYSHRSMFLHTLGMNQANAFGLTEIDNVLAVVPQFHAMCWGLPYGAALAGANLVMPGPFLDAPSLVQLLKQWKITVAAGVPTIWNSLYQELQHNPVDISTIRSLIVGGAAMPLSLIQKYQQELGVNVMPVWGMTETSPIGSVCHPLSKHQTLTDEELLAVKSSPGPPVAGVALRIARDHQELPWDDQSEGELQAKGHWIASGYYRTEVTEEHFTSDGWFRTGDIARINADGFIRITDRTKDLIKSGGEWISSVALENALLSHEGIRESAVVALPHDKWDERPLAVIVLQPQTEGIDLADIRNHLAQDFPRFWLPDAFAVIPEIPKTSVGKFDKKVIRQQIAEGILEIRTE